MFSSLLIEPDPAGIRLAGDLLRNGKLVAFPTETVYGLGANALNVDAVLDIFKAKGRPLTDPLIVHVAEPSAAKELIDITEDEERVFKVLTSAFWPGPLTVIVKASKLIPPPVTAHTGFVGIRCPNHRLARLLIESATVPIAAPSANRFGHVSPTRAEHVLADLGEKNVRVINGESTERCLDPPCQFGIESTVLKLDGQKKQATIFRQGAITQRQIESVLKSSGIDFAVVALVRAVKMHGTEKEEAKDPASSSSSTQSGGEVAPGQAVTHYAPDVPCFIIKSLATVTDTEPSSSSRPSSQPLALDWAQLRDGVVLIDYGGKFSSLASKVLAYRDLSSSGDSQEAARALFDTLRWSEAIPGAQRVLVAPVETGNKEIIAEQRQLLEDDHDMSLGVADRIFRAASGVYADVTIRDSSR